MCSNQRNITMEHLNHAENPTNTENCRYDVGIGSGALLDMLAEVASQTLHSDPSVKNSLVNESSCNPRTLYSDQLFNKRKRIICRNRVGATDTMDLEHIRTLSANHLIKLFSEFDGDEMKRIFQYTCFMKPERCNKQFSSFGNECKARQQMKNHLLEHVQLLELDAARGVKLAVEPIKVRHRRLADQLYNSANKKKKLMSKLSPDSTIKEGSNENDSNIPNKGNQRCSVENQFIFVDSVVQHPKVEKKTFNIESTDTNLSVKVEDGTNSQVLNVKYAHCEDSIPRQPDSSKENNLDNGIYYEHSYTTFETEHNSDSPSVESRTNCKDVLNVDTSADVPYIKLSPTVGMSHEETPAEDLGRFMVAETLHDTIMVCVMEDSQLQLKQLPCVGQEVDIGTSQVAPCKTIKEELPVLVDRGVELHNCNTEIKLETNCEKNIERDEYRQKKKPKGKAKFIGQSKAEKEMAIQLIDTMKRKGNTMESLECHICNPPRTFTAPTTLISHYRSHAGIKPYECRICRSVFTRQHSLNYHMLIHSNQTRFTCADCGRKFRHPSHFKEHRRRHTGESPYECSDCMLRFKTRNTYKRHLKTRHGKVLTTSGSLIILSEEEFKRVRTLPRSHQNSGLNAGEKQYGKNSGRKGKGHIKVNCKKKQKETCGVSEWEVVRNKEIEDKFCLKGEEQPVEDAKAAESSMKVGCLKEEKHHLIKSTPASTCNLNDIVDKTSLSLSKPETSENHYFQDIVEKAMRQSDISFSVSECDKTNTVNLEPRELCTWESIPVFRDIFFQSNGKEYNENITDVPKINIKSSWNTVNVHLKGCNKPKVCVDQSTTHKKALLHKGHNKCITQLLPKPVKLELANVPNSMGFSPLVINASNMTTILPNTTQVPGPLTFVRPQYSITNRNVNHIPAVVKTDIFGIVGQDGVNIINTDSQPPSIMVLANSSETPSQNFVLKNVASTNEESISIPPL